EVMYPLQIIIALSGIIYLICEKMLPIYDFRGIGAIIGALNLHSVVRMIMMHPMEYHVKKFEQLHLEKKYSKRQVDKENWEKEEKQNKEIQEKKAKRNKEIQEKKEKQSKEVEEEEETQNKEIQKKEKKYKTILKDLVDMSLVKNFCFINLCFGISFMYTSDFGFTYLSQPSVIIEDFNIEKFASAYDINSVFVSSLVTIIFGVIIGRAEFIILRPWAISSMRHISLQVINGVFILPWILQFIFVDFRKWRNYCAQKTNTDDWWK
ncbi:hypothetical protein ALC62_11158, partial [Cyphomyrmex costatus]